MIRETVVTTISADGCVHVAPIGLIEEPDGWIIAPFHPSRTLDNLRAVPQAVANYTDDVRIFAGCLTGRREWPCVACSQDSAATAECGARARRDGGGRGR